MTALRDISQIWTLLHVVVAFLLMFKSKYSPRRTMIAIFTMSAVMLCTCGVLTVWLGPKYVIEIGLFTCTIPSAILFYLLSEYRDGRFFFTFCVSDTCCIWLAQVTNLLDRLCGETYVVLFISRLILFPLLEVVFYRKLRKPYLELQAGLPGGWWTITAIAAGFYLLLYATSIPLGVPVREYTEVVRLVLVLILMPVTYLAILASLHGQMLHYETRNRQNLLWTQVAGLEERVAAAQAAEETVRIQRHDLRHKLLFITDKLKQGQVEEALAYIRSIEDTVEYTQPETWCGEPLLDSVFSAYFAKARQQGIKVKARLTLPEKLPVDAAELSTVFANALENAIHACAVLPPEKREIVCTCIGHPTLMLEVSNPYEGQVRLDGDGRPVASRQGHGIGTRSIAAFCEKYDAYCTYELEDGWFRLKIAV